MLNTTSALHIEGHLIEINTRGGWQTANGVCCPPHIQADLLTRIRDQGIHHCDGYTATNGIEYRWYLTPARASSRTTRAIALALAVALSIGLGCLLGAAVVCWQSWRAGGSADPRCAWWHLTGYVEVHRYRADGDHLSCEYRPEVGLNLSR